MQLKISGTFEGKCDLCSKESRVFSIGDEDTKKAVTVCKECSIKFGQKSVAEIVKEHGKVNEKVFEGGVKIEGKKTGG